MKKQSGLLISFDCGIKNLSYCVIHTDTKEIIDWNVIDILEPNKQNCCICDKKSTFYDKQNEMYYCGRHKGRSVCEKIKVKTIKNYTVLDINLCLLSVLRELQTKEYFNDISLSLIENQPQKNPKMKTLQYLLFSYFCFVWEEQIKEKQKKILFYSAKNKLKGKDTSKYECPYKDPYKKRKFFSVKITEELVETTHFYDFFLKHSKKDDLADCYLQALSYLK